MPAALQYQRSFDDLGCPLSDVTFCVLDLETTGGTAGSDRITEIGVVKVRGGECIGTFQTMVNPGCAIPPLITVLTGITDVMVSRAPRIESVLPTLLEFLGNATIVGHNITFDIRFLNDVLGRGGYPLISRAAIDTCALARRLVRDEVPNCKLSTLADRFRLDHRPSHRALADALATTDLLHLLIERASGYGVTGLDDLLALPKLGSHPQAAKLRHTDHLPRCPGVYLFHGPRDEVLYVGKATNLRQRVRSYFGGSESRRKVGGLLREVRRISHIATPDPLTAAVVELRLLHRHLPRYNRQGTTWDRYCYVRLSTDEAFPRLSVVRDPARRGVHLGPLPSRTMAQLVVDALHSAIPLRRCTQRLGRHYVPSPDASPCAAAQLGVSTCPCAGTIDAPAYGRLVDDAARALTSHPQLVLIPLRARMTELAAALRFEEAAAVRDRASAFAGALRRQQLTTALRSARTVHLRLNDINLVLEHGRLAAAGDGLPMPLPVEPAAGHERGPDGRRAAPHAAAPPAPPVEDPDRPLGREEFDEVFCVAKHLDGAAHRIELVECTGEWSQPAGAQMLIGQPMLGQPVLVKG